MKFRTGLPQLPKSKPPRTRRRRTAGLLQGAIFEAVPGWVLAVDGARTSGWAVYERGALRGSGVCDRDSDEVIRACLLALGGPSATPLRRMATVMVIEKPYASGHASAYVGLGAAIGIWGREFRRAGGGAEREVRVSPNDWRSAVLGRMRLKREQWKALAVQRVRSLYPGISDDDQAEAILIGHWASHSARVLAKLPKTVRMRAERDQESRR